MEAIWACHPLHETYSWHYHDGPFVWTVTIKWIFWRPHFHRFNVCFYTTCIKLAQVEAFPIKVRFHCTSTCSIVYSEKECSKTFLQVFFFFWKKRYTFLRKTPFFIFVKHTLHKTTCFKDELESWEKGSFFFFFFFTLHSFSVDHFTCFTGWGWCIISRPRPRTKKPHLNRQTH